MKNHVSTPKLSFSCQNRLRMNSRVFMWLIQKISMTTSNMKKSVREKKGKSRLVKFVNEHLIL